MWNDDANAMAVVELVHSGRLRRREGQRGAWEWLSGLPWTTRTARKGEIAVVESRRNDIESTLDRRWPHWKDIVARLEKAGLPVTNEGWKKLKDTEQSTSSIDLPRRLNQKSAIALVGPHSKAALTGSRRDALAGVEMTRDGIVRVRPNSGLTVRAGAIELEASRITAVTGEIVLTERALLDGTKLAGTPPATVLLVENLGPYVDIDLPDTWMAVHVPGWNTSTAKRLLDQLDSSTPIVHFGDLDPEGIQIVEHLQEAYPTLRWAVPAFWSEWVPGRAQRGEWPPDLDLATAPALVRELRDAGLWLEQETISLDPRLLQAMKEELGEHEWTRIGTKNGCGEEGVARMETGPTAALSRSR